MVRANFALKVAGFERIPSDYGYLAWTFKPETCSTTTTQGSAGTIQLQRIHVPNGGVATNINMYLGTAAVGGTSGQNFAGLWNAAGGAKIGITADQTTNWGTPGLQTMALAGGPYTLAAGDYYIGYWWNAGTSGPGWARASTIAGSFANGPTLATPNLICATANTGLTTTAPDPLGAQSQNSHNWWAALS